MNLSGWASSAEGLFTDSLNAYIGNKHCSNISGPKPKDSKVSKPHSKSGSPHKKSTKVRGVDEGNEEVDRCNKETYTRKDLDPSFSAFQYTIRQPYSSVTEKTVFSSLEKDLPAVEEDNEGEEVTITTTKTTKVLKKVKTRTKLIEEETNEHKYQNENLETCNDPKHDTIPDHELHIKSSRVPLEDECCKKGLKRKRMNGSPVVDKGTSSSPKTELTSRTGKLSIDFWDLQLLHDLPPLTQSLKNINKLLELKPLHLKVISSPLISEFYCH